ncbi:MAG: phosphoribosylformylglycinamidine synthase subunit PurQ [Planctomycetota bacterium]
MANPTQADDRPTALLIRAPGTNCDREMATAFELAGASAVTVHVDRLIADPAPLREASLVGLPGGFSYGDDVAAGRVFSHRLARGLAEPITAAVERGVPILGVCNGFQVLVKLGLLPGWSPGDSGWTQQTTLIDNAHPRFIDRWVGCVIPGEADGGGRCVWTRGLGTCELPIAHGEGRFAAPPAVLDRLEAGGQVALRYADPADNPNGSARAIAGITDPTGLVLGLMPHPERYTDALQHPRWTRLTPAERAAETPGLRLFRNAVEHVRNVTPVATPG